VKEKAKEYFLGKNGKRYNCAQAIIKACEGKICVPDSLVDDFAMFGFGKAPEGYCGSIYAARYLLNIKHKDKARELEDFFQKNAGAVRCRDIRLSKKFSCIDCVVHAAEFLEETFVEKRKE